MGCTDTSNTIDTPDVMPTFESPSIEITLEETIEFGYEVASQESSQIVEIPEEKVPLASSMLQSPSMNKVFATLTFPSCDITTDIYYGLTPMVLDTYKGVGLWVQPYDVYNSLPGLGKICVYGGHNYYEFNKLQYASVGDKFTIRTVTNTYTYEVVLAKAGDWDYQANIIVDSTPVIDWKFNNKREQAILYTCYPFNQVVTDKRFVVVGELLSD